MIRPSPLSRSPSPTRRQLFVAVLALTSAVAACGKAKKTSDKHAGFDPAAEAIEVDAAIIGDAGGALQATVKADVANTQVIKASATSRIVGTALAFRPASFDIDFDVTIQEGRSIATQKNLADLAYPATTIVQASSPAVVVSWSYDEDSLRPLVMTLPAPTRPAGSTDDTLVVIYLRNVAGSDENRLGVFPPAMLAVGAAGVSFETSSYGIYQAAYLSEVVPAAHNEVASTETVKSAAPIAGSPPQGPFTITGPKLPLSGASARVTWEAASLADSYDIKLDAKDPACGAPYRSYLGVKATSILVTGTPPLATGANFVCVVAKNASGATPATNSGFVFKADPQAPPAPGKPAAALGTSAIEVIFTWNAVVDVGEAGLARYLLEIGSTAGANDVFVGDVVEVTTKSIVGLNGQKFYARVKAVDTLGNESPWSASSDVITIGP